MKKVIIGLTEEVMNNATVAGYEQQSKNVMEFLNNKGIKINRASILKNTKDLFFILQLFPFWIFLRHDPRDPGTRGDQV